VPRQKLEREKLSRRVIGNGNQHRMWLAATFGAFAATESLNYMYISGIIIRVSKVNVSKVKVTA